MKLSDIANEVLKMKIGSEKTFQLDKIPKQDELNDWAFYINDKRPNAQISVLRNDFSLTVSVRKL